MRVGSREEGVRQGSRHSGDRGGTRGTALPRSPGKGRKSVKALGAGGVGTPYWGGGRCQHREQLPIVPLPDPPPTPTANATHPFYRWFVLGLEQD